MDDAVHLFARGSDRGWSDIDGIMSNEEADWIVKHGRYQWVTEALRYVASASDLTESCE